MKNIKGKIELIMAVIVLIGAGVLGRQGAEFASAVQTKNDGRMHRYQVVIDVGHGGIDSGKVSAKGVLEKDVNLIIAKKVGALLEQSDVSVIYTRESDTGLYRESDSNKKVVDLQNRCALIEKINPACTVSIHQNSYPAPEVHGAQTFYYGQSEEGKKLAEQIQQSLVSRVDPENRRQAKANDSYYLLKRTVSPTVIVECGFLSCPQEADLLIDDVYQDRIAWAIHMGVMQYLNCYFSL